MASCRSGFSSTAKSPGQAPKTSASEPTTDLIRPTAAALSPDGELLYVAQLGADGTAQLFTAPTGGALQPLATMTASSAALVMPLALAALPDGSGVLVADAGVQSGTGALGAVYFVDRSGSLVALPLGEMQAPVAIAAALDSKAAYVCGRAASDEQPGVWRVQLDGSAPQRVYKGAPLARPLALTVADDGAIYVADADALGPRTGALVRVQEGRALLLNQRALPLGLGAGLAPSGRGSGELLVLAAPTEPAWLLRVRVDGTWDAVAPVGPRPHEPLTLARAARADVWIAVDGVLETQPDPSNPVRGQLLRLRP